MSVEKGGDLNKEWVVCGDGRGSTELLAALCGCLRIVAFRHFGHRSEIGDDLREFCEAKRIAVLGSEDSLIEAGGEFGLLHSYPKILSQAECEELKVLNVHPSLLPRYRGLHSLVWALINDEPEVGYSVHEVVPGIDAGNIVFQGSFHVQDSDDINSLRRRMFEHQVENLGRVLLAYERGEIEPQLQDQLKATYVGRRREEDSRIIWSLTAREVFNFVRALKPPYTAGAYSRVEKQTVHITDVEWTPVHGNQGVVGAVSETLDDGSILVNCADGPLRVTEVRIDGMVSIPGEAVCGSKGKFW